MLQIVTGDPRPITRQITDGIKRQIAAGDLIPGDALPSVRGLAQQLSINPNTVVKAYRQLENEGMVTARPGQGTFITASVEPVAPGPYARLRRSLEQWVRDAYTAGHSRRVQQLSLAIGRELGLSQPELELLGHAALFHDIGKLAVPDAILNGDPGDRLPGNAHFSFPGCEGDALLMLLDARGIACSTGSACSAGVSQPSHVLMAMATGPERARGSLRFTLGHTSTEADVKALADAIGPAVERARRAGLS